MPHPQSDRTFSFITTSPPTSYFLKAAAGIEKGAPKPGTANTPHHLIGQQVSCCLFHTSPPGHQTVGKLSLKHIYEIAKIKAQDPAFEGVPLESVCKTVIGSARSLGIEIIR